MADSATDIASSNTVVGYRVRVRDENGLLDIQPPKDFNSGRLHADHVRARYHARQMAQQRPHEVVELFELRAVTVIQEKQIAFVV